jgi:para-nitrobenzyl esterase
MTEGDFVVFRGIPYAAPPVGDLRWRPPAPPPAWTGTKVAGKLAGDCIRAGAKEPTGNEDCLYLNVWTEAKAATDKLPVAVLLPGVEGASGLDGAALAKLGVVVVTANSRTGVMGFLAHPDLSAESEKKASGNYGLMDQAAVLDWVQSNIAGFGGDPANVTPIGPYVTWLPRKTRLIVTSMGGAQAMPLADGEKAGEAFAQAENAHSLRFLRPMEASDLVQGAVDEHYNPGPVMDGVIIRSMSSSAPPRTEIQPLDMKRITELWLNLTKEGRK